ncbi:T-box transcription factor T-like isoform X2 [Dysidea avara]|uniref:T-box transcription factor T-like isoform X2 n=1 Tax=Dysidea avara TaxID=196820 RepID=UPI00332C4EB0
MAKESGTVSIHHLLSGETAVDSKELQKLLATEDTDVDKKEVAVELEDDVLWRQFHEHTNEMIVTKTGRRMFPVLKFNLSGLKQDAMYTVLLDFMPADTHRWKYLNGSWVSGGKGDPLPPSCVYVHPDSPNYGSHWMKQAISFSRVKLTNKINGKVQGKMILNSLHRYEPRVHILRVDGSELVKVMSVSIAEARFIAVTAYQNEEITALKIKHNPFAKAFLDTKDSSSRIERSSVNNYYTPSPQISSYSQLTNSSAGWVLSSPPMLTSRESQYIRHAPYPSPTLHHKVPLSPGLQSHSPTHSPIPYYPTTAGFSADCFQLGASFTSQSPHQLSCGGNHFI